MYSPRNPSLASSLATSSSEDIEIAIGRHERTLVEKGLAKKIRKKQLTESGLREESPVEATPEKPFLDDLDAFSEKYVVFYDPIGQGGYSVVHRGIRKDTEEEVAIKVVPKCILDETSQDMLLREIAISQGVNHPNLMKTYDIYESDAHYFFVMEMLGGGSLFDLINKTSALTEPECISIIHKLLFALKYLHTRGITHRDIKLGNILFRNPPRVIKGKRAPVNLSSFYGVKLADYGLASLELSAGRSRMSLCVGTPAYVPPEMMDGDGYTEKLDMWALGITLYAMKMRRFPWPSTDPERLMPMLEHFEELPSFDPENWSFSKAGKSFLSGLLCREEERMSAEDALRHPWIHQSPSMKGMELVTPTLISKGYLSPKPPRRSNASSSDAPAATTSRTGGSSKAGKEKSPKPRRKKKLQPVDLAKSESVLTEMLIAQEKDNAVRTRRKCSAPACMFNSTDRSETL